MFKQCDQDERYRGGIRERGIITGFSVILCVCVWGGVRGVTLDVVYLFGFLLCTERMMIIIKLSVFVQYKQSR